MALDFGLTHPLKFLMQSRGLIGVNMLRVAESRPDILQSVFHETIALADQGVFTPHIFRTYDISELAEAHANLENRETVGKLVVKW